MSVNPIVKIEGLTCRYGSNEAVRDLCLEVPEGSTFAFLGTNGAGKTTTIKTILNLLPSHQGAVTVFGLPVRQLGPTELAQIGYVSEDQKLPEKLTVRELLAYSRALYPTWDEPFCQRLITLLALPLDRQIKQFSRGMKIKAALLVSLAYRPRLLILDEPFSGLDPLVRDELLQSLVGLFESESWTMFVSSHDIEDVERLADWVGFLDQGRLCISEPIESLQSRFRRIDVMLAEGQVLRTQLPADCMIPEISGATARWIEPHFVSDEASATLIESSFPPGVRFSISPLTLREIFVAVTRHTRPAPPLPIV